MPKEKIKLSLIIDNPYNPRSYYHPTKVTELASSIRQVGLIEIPQARKVKNEGEGFRYELAYGGYRRRAYELLRKQLGAKEWGEMPLDIQDITDEQMAVFGLEENLKRSDMTPMDTARAIAKYFEIFPETKESDLATKLSMSQGNVSNMLRVLTCPKEILDKIDEGKINFTMARELLVLQGLSGGEKQEWKGGQSVMVAVDDKQLMLEACHGVTGQYGNPTINGIKKEIFRVGERYFPRLDKGSNSYYYSHRETQFDTKAANCMKCDHMLRLNETTTQYAHFCTDKKCWQKHQDAHVKAAAAEAQRKMQADLAARVIKDINEPQTISKKSSDSTVDVAEKQLTATEIQTLEKAQVAQVEKEVSREELAAEERRRQLANMPANYPCLHCTKIGICNGTGVISKSRQKEGGEWESYYSCEDLIPDKVEKEKITKAATVQLPPVLLEKIKDKGGTRAEVLDIHHLGASNYTNELTKGHVYLSAFLSEMANPDECLKQCTKGFHYAYDSSNPNKSACYVCTDPKCVAKKKAEFTRQRNARGMLRKKTETAAIKEAIAKTERIGVQEIKLVFWVAIEKQGNSYYARNRIAEWIYNRLKIENKFNSNSELIMLVKAFLEKMAEKELAGLLIEFMLEQIRYEGDVKNYKIQTTEALNLLKIGVNVPQEAKEPPDNSIE